MPSTAGPPGCSFNLGTCGGFEGEIERGTLLLVERTLVYDIFEQMGDCDAGPGALRHPGRPVLAA